MPFKFLQQILLEISHGAYPGVRAELVSRLGTASKTQQVLDATSRSG